MNYQEQLSIELMELLATRATLYQRSKAEYSDFWLNIMDSAFDRCYQEIYGYLPHGC